MSKTQDTSFDWRSPAWFAERWDMHPVTASKKLIELHALRGVPRIGKGKGLRYHVESVQQALMQGE
jgi:hypothetical protein